MGRSAKVVKRPTRKEKAASKVAKANAKPLPPPPRPVRAEVEKDEEGRVRKRKTMRAKIDKVSAEAERDVREKGRGGWGEEKLGERVLMLR
jgi:hypothetical protein